MGSNHPEHIIKNIPKSLFFRIRRICTYLEDYFFYSGLISEYLVLRGHKKIDLRKVRFTIAQIDRNILIPYKNKNNFNLDKNTILFKEPFDTCIRNFKDIALDKILCFFF